jgi:hypothetical protein
VIGVSIDWQIVSVIGTEIQEAIDFQAVIEIWHQHLTDLHDCKLIYSQREEADTILPSKTWPRNFSKGGYLRSLFAYDNLFFLDRRIAVEQWLGLESNFNLDSSVEFDTNVASYVEGFVENRPGPNSDRVKEVFDFVVTTEEVNFGYNFYALENAQGFFDGSRVQSIRRNLRSIIKFDHINKKEYQATGEIRATISDKELDVKADEKLHEIYDSHYREMMEAEFIPTNEVIYILLLKIVEIEYRDKKRKLRQKVEELYEFMHFELKTLVVREAMIAINYFKNKARLAFFGRIGPRPNSEATELLKELRNMSWDLMLFRIMDRMAGISTQHGDFLIPYFLTFDRKMVELFDLFPLKAVIAYGDAQIIPLWETNPLEAIRKEVSTKGIDRYFGDIARKVRHIERCSDMQTEFSSLGKKLEQSVVRLLSY